MNKKYISGKNFLITGAGSGIGFETTRILLESGANIYAFVRNPETVESFSMEFKDNFFHFQGDVALQKDCEKFVYTAVKKFKIIHGLIHCAGVGLRSPAREIKHDVFRSIMDINFYAMVYLYSACRKYLEESNGHVVAVSSVQGLVALPYRSAYSAAKHALNAYIKSIRLEERKVHFLCVNFGYVKTKFSHNALTGKGEKFSRQGKGQLKGIEVNKAAQIMLDAMIKRKKEIIPAGFKEKLTIQIHRFCPVLYDKLIGRYVKPD